ncbi:phage tail protein, partial [Enterobacter hormaechei]|uniref:phage tail protein n=1 Tax=Enterobacter hormaechei TaxID=158836 RepID=UPI003CC661FF
MYVYPIQVLAMDFSGQLDDLMLPLLAWIWENQPDLLLNPDSNKKIEFDADIVSESSFMYVYPIQVLAMDFSGQLDDLMLPLLAWI